MYKHIYSNRRQGFQDILEKNTQLRGAVVTYLLKKWNWKHGVEHVDGA